MSLGNTIHTYRYQESLHVNAYRTLYNSILQNLVEIKLSLDVNVNLISIPFMKICSFAMNYNNLWLVEDKSISL